MSDTGVGLWGGCSCAHQNSYSPVGLTVEGPLALQAGLSGDIPRVAAIKAQAQMCVQAPPVEILVTWSGGLEEVEDVVSRENHQEIFRERLGR